MERSWSSRLRTSLVFSLGLAILPMSFAGSAWAQGQATSSLTIVKDVTPDDTTDFFFTLNGPSPGGAQLDDDATAPGGNSQIADRKQFDVVPGVYEIVEQNPGPGWALANVKCTDPTQYNVPLNLSIDLPAFRVKVEIPPKTNIVCTFTNTKTSPPPTTGTITVIKQSGDPQDFWFYSFGPNSGCCAPFPLDDDNNPTLANSKTFTLAPGSYSIKEDLFNPTPVTGWTLSGIKCTGGNATIDMNSMSFTTNLLAGQNLVCTFTNTKNAPPGGTGTLTIIKDAAPNDPLDFSFTSNSTNIPGFSLDDDSDATLPSSKTFVLPAGTLYTITETAAPGWTLTAIKCTGPGFSTVTLPGRSASVLFTAGQTTTCTFTNKKIPPPLTGRLTIIKDAAPNDPQDFTFTSNSPSIGSFALDDDSDATLSSSKTMILPAGSTYTVTEGASPGWGLTAITCTGGTVSVLPSTRTMSVPLAAGQNVICTFKNASCAMQATVNIYNPMQPFGPQVVNICRNGTVKFVNVSSGTTHTIAPTTPPGSFGSISLGSTAGSSMVTTAFNAGGTYKYLISGFTLQGTIIVYY